VKHLHPRRARYNVFFFFSASLLSPSGLFPHSLPPPVNPVRPPSWRASPYFLFLLSIFFSFPAPPDYRNHQHFPIMSCVTYAFLLSGVPVLRKRRSDFPSSRIECFSSSESLGQAGMSFFFPFSRTSLVLSSPCIEVSRSQCARWIFWFVFAFNVRSVQMSLLGTDCLHRLFFPMHPLCALITSLLAISRDWVSKDGQDSRGPSPSL